jgi:hypothetical protein
MGRDDSFEPVIDRVTPPPAVRVRSAAGLVVLLVVVGVAVGLAVVAVIVVAVLALNNAL